MCVSKEVRIITSKNSQKHIIVVLFIRGFWCKDIDSGVRYRDNKNIGLTVTGSTIVC